MELNSGSKAVLLVLKIWEIVGNASKLRDVARNWRQKTKTGFGFFCFLGLTQKSFLQPTGTQTVDARLYHRSWSVRPGLVFLKELLDKQKPSMRLCAVEASLSIEGGDNQDHA